MDVTGHQKKRSTIQEMFRRVFEFSKLIYERSASVRTLRVVVTSIMQGFPLALGNYTINSHETVLVTGANGFIGAKVVEALLGHGFTNLRCFVRSEEAAATLRGALQSYDSHDVEIVQGNLLSSEDCASAVDDVRVVYHLAASTGDASIAGARKNSVDTTRTLLDALADNSKLIRFVNVSSLSVYSNSDLSEGALLDETCPKEHNPESRGDAYSYGKIKQEQLLEEYGSRSAIPFVNVRPGIVYGPGSAAIAGRVGMRVRGIFLHMGQSNVVPFTYVDNCAKAIVLAGLQVGIDGEAFNIIDDDVITSREFLRMYKKSVGGMPTIELPKALSLSMFLLLGGLLKLLRGGATPKYNHKRWSTYWKGNTYTNDKAKRLLHWSPDVSSVEGMRRYFEYCRESGSRDA